MRIPLVFTVLAALASSAQAAEVDRFLPDDAEAVVHVNVRQLLDAPVVRKHFAREIQNALDSDAFKPRAALLALGIHPLRDISSVTVATPALPAEDKGLIVVRGKFDLRTIQDTAEAHAANSPDELTIHKDGDFRIYELTEKRSGRKAFLCWLDKETLAAAPAQKGVKEAIARHQGKTQAKPSKEFKALLDQVDGKQAVWVAALASDDLKKAAANNPQVRKSVDPVQTLHGGLRADEGLQVDLVLRTNDPRAAAEIRKLLDGIKSIVGLAAMDHDRLGSLPSDLANAMKVSSDKGDVTLKGQMTAAEIEKSLKAKPGAQSK